jgi:magnesium-transporting ATPase (P-type)
MHLLHRWQGQGSTWSLSVLVVIEMLNALNAISEDNSLLTMSPFINPYLLLAIAGSIGLHIMIVYPPWMATDLVIALHLVQAKLVLLLEDEDVFQFSVFFDQSDDLLVHGSDVVAYSVVSGYAYASFVLSCSMIAMHVLLGQLAAFHATDRRLSFLLC